MHCQYRHDELDDELSETQKLDALIKLRKDLKDAIEKARTLKNDNEEKGTLISRTLAENDSLKQNKEALERRITMTRKALGQ